MTKFWADLALYSSLSEVVKSTQHNVPYNFNLFEENNCANLFPNSYINTEVLVWTCLDGHMHEQMHAHTAK